MLIYGHSSALFKSRGGYLSIEHPVTFSKGSFSSEAAALGQCWAGRMRSWEWALCCSWGYPGTDFFILVTQGHWGCVPHPWMCPRLEQPRQWKVSLCLWNWMSFSTPTNPMILLFLLIKSKAVKGPKPETLLPQNGFLVVLWNGESNEECSVPKWKQCGIGW